MNTVDTIIANLEERAKRLENQAEENEKSSRECQAEADQHMGFARNYRETAKQYRLAIDDIRRGVAERQAEKHDIDPDAVGV